MTNYSLDNEISNITNELNYCRDDERSIQSNILKIISITVAILGIIFSTSFLDIIKTNNISIAFKFCSCIFCVSFSYICTLGISNVLRFHYIRDLEDKLSKLIPSKDNEENIVQWMSFSAPTLTRNIFNLKTFFSTAHYFLYFIAICFSIGFCILIIFELFKKIENHSVVDVLLFLFTILLSAIIMCVFLGVTINAKSMYLFSLHESRIKRVERMQSKETKKDNEEDHNIRHNLEKNYIKQLLNLILYFIYPKTKDIQKMFMIVIGFLSGIFLIYEKITFDIFFELFQQLILVILIIDVLLYQARYQWNDIRGLEEDKKLGSGLINCQKGKKFLS